MSTDLKLSKAQISKIIQTGGFLGSLLSKLDGPLIKVAIPLAKNVLAPLEIYSCCFSNWCKNSKKMHGSGATILIISNEEMTDTMKIIQALEDSKILLKGVTKTMKQKDKKKDF